MLQRLAIANGHGWQRFLNSANLVLPKRGDTLGVPLEMRQQQAAQWEGTLPVSRMKHRASNEAHRQLDRLCSLLAKPIPGANEQTGPEPEQTLVAILQSLPGAGRIVLATLLEEAFETLQRADYPILRILCGVAPVTRR
jgi:hypothetical protein